MEELNTFMFEQETIEISKDAVVTPINQKKEQINYKKYIGI